MSLRSECFEVTLPLARRSGNLYPSVPLLPEDAEELHPLPTDYRTYWLEPDGSGAVFQERGGRLSAVTNPYALAVIREAAKAFPLRTDLSDAPAAARRVRNEDDEGPLRSDVPGEVRRVSAPAAFCPLVVTLPLSRAEGCPILPGDADSALPRPTHYRTFRVSADGSGAIFRNPLGGWSPVVNPYAMAIVREALAEELARRRFDLRRFRQGFRGQAHLDAFFRAFDHAHGACAECQALGAPVWIDDGWQPTLNRCAEGRRLEEESFRLGERPLSAAEVHALRENDPHFPW